MMVFQVVGRINEAFARIGRHLAVDGGHRNGQVANHARRGRVRDRAQ